MWVTMPVVPLSGYTDPPWRHSGTTWRGAGIHSHQRGIQGIPPEGREASVHAPRWGALCELKVGGWSEYPLSLRTKYTQNSYWNEIHR